MVSNAGPLTLLIGSRICDHNATHVLGGPNLFIYLSWAKLAFGKE